MEVILSFVVNEVNFGKVLQFLFLGCFKGRRPAETSDSKMDGTEHAHLNKQHLET